MIVLLALVRIAMAGDGYAAARSELVAAYQAGDFPAMVTAAEKALQERPGYPAARFNLALAHALSDDAESALDELDRLLEAGIDFGVDEMDEFAAVRALSRWPDFERRVRKLYEPTGDVHVALQRDEGRFIPEGIAVDGRGRILLGSIRKGTIVRGDDVLTERHAHWSVFGMRFHEDGSLWFASAAVPQLENVGADRGRTGLFRLDTGSGKITRAAVLPHDSSDQLLGDLVIDGDLVYATDSATGAVYRYDIGTDEFTTVAGPGTFGSPQGLALNASGDYLFIADYVGGLYRLAIDDGETTRLVAQAAGTDYGIDGLYRHGDRLVAIQNGIRPHRVVSFRLMDDDAAISAPRILAANLPAFDEPTLGAIRGDDFYFVANSHWNRFDQEGELPDGLTGPIVLKLSLVD